MKLHAIIVEDEEVSRQILKNYIKKYCPNIKVLGEAGTIEEAYNLIQQNTLDLVFLDVEMPYGNAFDLLEKVENRTFETIFVTAYDHYAIEALNNNASYYLLKPISIDDLIKAVNIVTEICEKEHQLKAEILAPQKECIKGKITLPQQDGFEVLDVNEILFCKADDNYTEIYTKEKKKLVSKTLKYFEEALKDYPFVRVHKSYLVNVNTITKYKKGKGGSVLLSNGQEITVSSSKKAKLLSYFT
ncbi:LytR/AlgR family response regulator transcription factor [Tenacibaculum maritimum]|uniref:LytR/AlgR family response regulator transcription factor n=1 Tax=Tenacibaculum maritimum TaxID=107401 RepID=UPI0003FA08AB|nr:LytTR family DNA-binding domain-containing protein [Tenacibaculum maritimum]MCD9562003.1 LytTR family DNA-binding domain-containing protein [Tenacibaculum maritimum]MCD9565087.1 LytTR family DNA-binding domain-containing protein [Tenacibaculum maritimum]MCD9579060.1 LytTR family DNA-binding domain-containing protein [Tenacibaculum maritimum]MCD9595914.1 LytTR family DNA-binding domain-containing protein [Tenacibaculum maritimum]MCD9614701.1 LytTR family DNA-binding domain-containing protein